MRHALATILGWLLVISLADPLLAHHSFEAEFDDSKTVELVGTIAKIDWLSPHIYIYLDVKDQNGKVTTWTVQSLPNRFFRRAGLTKNMLMGAEGQTVTITAYASRDSSKPFAFLKKILYPDGHSYELHKEAAYRAKSARHDS